jgi:hypothetical protein
MKEGSVSMQTEAMVVSLADPVVDLRAAMESPDREARMADALQRLEQHAACGCAAEILWPCDRDLAAASLAAGMPLAQHVAHIARESGSRVTVRTRSASISDFLALVPSAHLRFIFHLNGEEAAMRFERRDAAPSRRLAAAARLAREGWDVGICVGAVRPSGGWREDYRDLASMIAAAGFAVGSIAYPGECAMDRTVEAGGDGLVPVIGDEGVRFLPTPRQRRDIQKILSAPPVSDFPGSPQTQPHSAQAA